MNTNGDPTPSRRPGTMPDSSTGLDTQLAGLLCYLLGFVSGLLFLLVEQKDRDVRFHAYQSTLTFLGLFVASIAASIVPLIGGIVAFLLPFVTVGLWLFLMYQAFQGVRYKLPMIGDWAEERAG